MANSLTFTVPADAYDRHVGRYGAGLGVGLVDAAGVRPGQRALDVGSGPGALTRVLVDRLGTETVAAVDPSEPFVAALEERVPGIDARIGTAENLPFPDDAFDAVLAQLVVNFMSNPEQGAREMRRTVKPGGVVAACVWDYPDGMTLLRSFWDAASELDPAGVADRDERTRMRFARRGELGELWRNTGLTDVEDGELIVAADYESFDDLWAPFAAGVAPSGAYAAALAAPAQERLRQEFRRRLGSPDGPLRLSARAWYATGHK
jgi:SAM-dependent methyltransferase